VGIKKPFFQPKVKSLGQKVTVHTDNGAGGFDKRKALYLGSMKGRFTPKTIQTKDERANMVHAIKVECPMRVNFQNGMYGEINFL